MSAQKSILNFFQKSPATKRLLEPSTKDNIQVKIDQKKLEDEKDSNQKELHRKRLKLDNENSECNKVETTVEEAEDKIKIESKSENDNKITKDDKINKNTQEIIENNKYKAKLILVSKQTFGLINNFGISWFKVLEPEFSKPYFLKLSEFVHSERQKATVFPPEDLVFSWTKYCEIDEVKVVILGQDPYHGPNQAHGLCFSVRKNVPPPPSLINIYKELKNDIDGFEPPKHGTLIGWATQGVLLLNACLTVRKSEANSHKDHGWETFTDSVIKAISSKFSNVVFLLWGAYAQKKGLMIDSKKHYILNAPHPSPLSASKGWFGCKHFSKANTYLIEKNKTPINWTNLPSEDEYEAILKAKS